MKIQEGQSVTLTLNESATIYVGRKPVLLKATGKILPQIQKQLEKHFKEGVPKGIQDLAMLFKVNRDKSCASINEFRQQAGERLKSEKKDPVCVKLEEFGNTEWQLSGTGQPLPSSNQHAVHQWIIFVRETAGHSVEMAFGPSSTFFPTKVRLTAKTPEWKQVSVAHYSPRVKKINIGDEHHKETFYHTPRKVRKKLRNRKSS